MNKRNVQIAFRVDASMHIGTGHLMRCLTLADALRNKGADCVFVCREHSLNLLDPICQRGFLLHMLPIGVEEFQEHVDIAQPLLGYASWLGGSWDHDAEQTIAAIKNLQLDWLVVDHYAIDSRWERALKPHCRKLMVIDDLADRPHLCNLLLDQTLARNPDDYRPWVPGDCTLLVGSQFALLRREFSTLREYSIRRRESPKLMHLLITMGGVDKDNVTGDVLDALKESCLPRDCRITVVMGSASSWLASVQQQGATLPWQTDVRVNAGDMAQLMASSDLAIGAAGATSWERCCLGLPTLMMVLADNQVKAASNLERANAVKMLPVGPALRTKLHQAIREVCVESHNLSVMTESGIGITDGNGADRVVDYLLI